MTVEQLEVTRKEMEIRETVANIAPHQPEVAEVLAYLLAENRRLLRIIAGMEERVETAGLGNLADRLSRESVRAAVDCPSEAYREYAQSGAFDPRD